MDQKMRIKGYVYKVQFANPDNSLFGEPLYFKDSLSISGFMKDNPELKMLSVKDITREGENPTKNSPTRWKYKDRTGVEREGEFVDFYDFGGTDVGYSFKRDDGTIDIVSGNRLKEAKVIRESEKKNPPPRKKEIRFRDLNNLDIFHFESASKWYGGSMAQGPWMKTGPRTYAKYDPLTNTHVGIVHRVGTINVGVIPGRDFPKVDYSSENPPLNWDSTVQKLSEAEYKIDYALSQLEFADIPWKELKENLRNAMLSIAHAKSYIRHSHSGHFTYNENPPATEVYRDIIEIRARKKDGRLYKHNFQPGSTIFGLPDGSILVKSRKGKKLWKDFPKGRK